MTKTIVVVGASRGIGKAMVEQFAQNGNHHVIAISRNIDGMTSDFASFENVRCHAFDLCSDNIREQLEALFANVESIEVLINNAGLLINKPFLELTREDLNQSYSVNVLSVIETVQALLPKMPSGHIVNISSMGGFQGSVKFPGLSAYSTSKAALVSFTELFSEEFKDHPTAMNCLCLGAVQTEMLNEAFPGYEAPLSAEKMAEYIVDFSLNANKWMRGKVIPVSLSTP